MVEEALQHRCEVLVTMYLPSGSRVMNNAAYLTFAFLFTLEPDSLEFVLALSWVDLPITIKLILKLCQY